MYVEKMRVGIEEYSEWLGSFTNEKKLTRINLIPVTVSQ
jgi:hypothetical protein